MSRASQFYQVGGALAPDVPSYIERATDEDLYQQVREGRFCYVLTTRQMGKTSLMYRTAERLRAEGTHVATVDLTGFGTHEHSVTADQWYYGIAETVLDDLGLDEDLGAWWDQGAKLPPLQRLLRFLRDVVLAKTSGPVVIFVDEIDSTLNLSFAGDFFAGIRSCYNARAENPELDRLTFVLLGVASPTDLISDPRRTPFNIGTAIHLTDFTTLEALPLAEGLGGEPAGREEPLERVLFWTGGHPYLTQKVCLRAADAAHDGVSPDDIDRLVEKEFLAAGADRKDPNLSFVRNRIIDRGALTLRLLRLYRRVLRGEAVADNPTAPVQTELKLTGLVKTSDNGTLVVRNEIYRRVFGEKWINEVWPPATTPMRVAVAAVGLLLLSPLFWYEVLYPRQFIHTLKVARSAEVNLAHDAYVHLRKIPFHGGQASALWGEFHARRAAGEKDRDTAILLWLMALKAEPSREDYRRNAIRLVEPDYTRLVGTTRTGFTKDAFKSIKDIAEYLKDEATYRVSPLALVVISIALSHDGRQLALGGISGDLQVWDLVQPRALLVLHKSPGPWIRAVAFSTDGTRLFTAEPDGEVRLWRLDQPSAESVLLRGHRESITAVAFSADGTRLAAAGVDDTLWVRRVDHPTAEPVLLRGNETPIYALAISADGTRLVTGSSDGTVRLWRIDQPTAQPVFLRGNEKPFRAVAFSADGTQLVIGCVDGTVRLWRVDQPTAEPVLLLGHESLLESVAFSPEGKLLVTANWEGTVRLWRVDHPTAEPLLGDPDTLLAEWQKKLALKIEDNGEIIPAH